MSDIKLCYFGGSGGFIILHLLLLSEKFHCVFSSKNNGLHDVIEKQWNIVDPIKWKHNENWPDNYATLLSENSKSKIYFFCNPTIETISEFDGETVLLYTDVESQFELAFLKRAWLLRNLKIPNYIEYYKKHLKVFKSNYDNIKDPTWPLCYGPKKFSRLPQSIQQEVTNSLPNCWDFPRYSSFVENPRSAALDIFFSKKIKMLTNGDRVIEPVFDFFYNADKTIKLQNVINNLDLLSDITHVPTNQLQLDLKNKWVSLHPQNLLNKININNI